ncbi:small GTP-binding protein [Neohortaea acidophila]|uniref:Small GTP-binding protein n=1 Tax=Neohortaea acidophila TaxID=245834 RepID=A0A6A6PFH0_9PEZI|nr:small GTP-binding protein [Neohortaea acidophila]KAF2478729.1 small GTP-binding protein [Neohortaea acidophila]
MRAVAASRFYSSLSTGDDSTIYALSTAPGRAAIAIVRVSGPACLDIYKALCPGKPAPRPRYATLRTIYEPFNAAHDENVLDPNALIFNYPAPRTVTGEDVLELHIHGGPATTKAVLAAIPRCTTASKRTRYAEPGEFTRRAFMNDRLDLTQVEALGDVLSATTEQQRRLSVRGTTDRLAKLYEGWRQHLLYARGELEALIDFSEDQHFDESPAELCASVSEQVLGLRRMVLAHSHNAMKGELLRHGISIALLGAPNAGKSSLLNCVIGREAAIVSQEAGTTRDVIEVGLDLGGYFCRLGDTAGLRKHQQGHGAGNVQPKDLIGQIEEEGMRRTKARASESDVVIVVLSFETNAAAAQLRLDPEVVSTASELVRSKDNVVVVINKSDLATNPQQLEQAIQTTMSALPGITADRIHIISCKEAENPRSSKSTAPSNNSGIQPFLQGLINFFASLTSPTTPDVPGAAEDPSMWQDSLGASERHRLLLVDCADHLEAFLLAVDPALESVDGGVEDHGDADIVVAAEHLRAAADCLARITGKGEAGDVEEVLGVVFEKFCVGK